jgi:hypothetical protein
MTASSSSSSSVFIKLPDHLEKAVNAGDATMSFDAAAQRVVVALGGREERWASPVVACAAVPQGLALTQASNQSALPIPSKHAVDFSLVPVQEPPQKAAPRTETATSPAAAPVKGSEDAESSGSDRDGSHNDNQAAVVAAL